MGTLEEALQAGQSAYTQAGTASRDQQRIDLSRGQDTRQAALDEINQRLGADKVQELRSQFLAQEQVRKADMVNYAEANGAFDTYAKAVQAIPPGDPDRVQKVTDLKLQYMPSIAKHPAIAQKFDALDKTDRQSDAWVSHSILMQQLAGLQQNALRYNLGPEAIGLLDGVRQGRMPAQDAVAKLNGAITARREEEQQKERDFELERAGVAARVRAGALSERDREFGRWSPNYRTPGDTMDAAGREELASLRDQLTAIGKSELDLHLRAPNRADAMAAARWDAEMTRLAALRDKTLERMKQLGGRHRSGPADAKTP